MAGHIGYPWTTEVIALATKYPNVYIDTSAYRVSRYPPELIEFLRGHCRGKVMFGSNHPAWPPSLCLEGLDALALDLEVEKLLLAGNAVRVFQLDR